MEALAIIEAGDDGSQHQAAVRWARKCLTRAITKGKSQHNVVDALGVGCEITREVQDDSRVFGVEEWSCHKLRWGQLIKEQVWRCRKDLECSLGRVEFEVSFRCPSGAVS